jgi:uncharacterized coiled-coil protein SlyX
MSKNRKSISQWLSDTFGNSHKAISEKLSAEEYSAFTAEAGALQPEQEEEGDGPAGDPDPQAATGQTSEPTLEQRIAALEASLTAEKQKGTGLQAKLDAAQKKLQQSEEQKAQLRQAVNPLGSKDAADVDAAEDQFLTAADQEARKAWTESQS